MKNNRIIIGILLICVLASSVAASGQQVTKKDIITQMTKVADWQLAQSWPTGKAGNPIPTGSRSWEAGAFYPGVMDAYRATKNEKYLEPVKLIAEANQYERGPQLRNADDQAILQTYLEMYEFTGDPKLLTATKRTLDSIMLSPKPGRVEFSWCDLLFMGPPIWSRYSAISKDQKYLDYLTEIYWDAADHLQNKTYKLFYRDDRFKTIIGPTGKPVFWSRGNGWVVAGLARTLEAMPARYPGRKKYEDLLIELASSLKSLQQPDGFWKSDLLDPQIYPMGETSGTAFFCYGIAWAINHKLLDRRAYLPVVLNAWKALNGAVLADGKLGFVQPGGDRPYLSNVNMSNWYAAGGFLMAGNQVLKLTR